MKHKKEKRKAWAAAAGVLALALAVWAALGFVTGAWISFGKKAVALQNSQFQVEAEFAGLETISGDGLAWDSLKLRIECPEGKLDFYDDQVLVEYWLLGKWYQVLDSRHTYSVSHSYVGYEGPEEKALRFPAGLFSRFGLYRVRLVATGWKTGEAREAGSCEFWVTKPTRRVKGTHDNDFDSWCRLEEGEDFIDEHLSLSFKSIYYDEEAQTRLVFGLTCDREYYGYGEETRVDRLWNGQWYSVSRPMAVRAYAMRAECVPGEEEVMTAVIPNQVLGHKGKYRLYWGGAAYCEFEIA